MFSKPKSEIQIGDQVEAHLDSSYWKSRGWFSGRVVRIDPYSAHRCFYWVELDHEVEAAQGGCTHLISIFNVKRIRKPCSE
ncbi:MAG: hypothetical protein Fur0016_07550 [Anaerolineales bacterium]